MEHIKNEEVGKKSFDLSIKIFQLILDACSEYVNREEAVIIFSALANTMHMIANTCLDDKAQKIDLIKTSLNAIIKIWEE